MQYNDLPTEPGALLGYRRNGLPIYLIAGGSGEGGDGGGTGEGTGGDPGTGQDGGNEGQDDNGGQNPPTNDPGQNDDGDSTDGDVSTLPPWAQRAIKAARADAGKARTTAKAQAADAARQDLAQQIGKALGLVKDGDDAPDPATLPEQLAGAQNEELRTARTELAVFKAAGKHGADPTKLLDSRSFADKLANVDPADGKKVAELIKKAVEDNPSYKTAAPPPASGAPMGGSPPTPKNKSLDAAIAARYRK